MAQEVSEYSPKRYTDARLDRVLQGNRHQHCHFTDVNGKDVTFENYDFSYCIFIRAYFHNTTFVKCKFTGAHFIDCNFRNAQLRDCDFSYSNFNGTRLPTREILNNLPSWPNVRREVLQILRRNAASVGDYSSEREFVIREIDSAKEHYRRAWRRDEPYYRSKYNRNLKWLAAGAQLLAFKIDNFVWGHGERLWKALIAAVVFLFGLSFLLAVIAVPNADQTTLSDLWRNFLLSFVYNVNLFLDVPDKSGVRE
jgi:Pentapeptide repeats (8 copies)